MFNNNKAIAFSGRVTLLYKFSINVSNYQGLVFGGMLDKLWMRCTPGIAGEFIISRQKSLCEKEANPSKAQP